MTEQIINSRKSLEAYKQFLDEQFKNNGYVRVTCKTGRQRTRTQNSALHLFCKLLADELNAAGYDFRTFVKEGYAVPFNEQLVKDHVWRPIQKAVTGKDSTTKPERNEYGLIYDVLNQKMAEYGIYVPWPCKETQQEEAAA